MAGVPSHSVTVRYHAASRPLRVDFNCRNKSHEQQRDPDQEEHRQRQASAQVVVAGDGDTEEPGNAGEQGGSGAEEETGCHRGE